ncbi:unnamed protein product [Meloidogyne enterolobii]|uniref:Uncharacterized protein n=1 Tax=Meloidogyne enterolobii TaxID=390850 RepID=A0ACB1ASK4_MELEN
MDHPSNNNNIHQKHSQSLKTLLTVPIQQNTQQNIQHSPTNSFCSVGNISINTIASSSTVFPTSTKEDVCKVTCFPVILPKTSDEQQTCFEQVYVYFSVFGECLGKC